MTPEELDAQEAQIQEELKDITGVDILKLADAAERAAQDTSNMLPSGFSELDECMDGGFREGDFTIVSGIPGDGKTTLCRMLTLNFSAKGIPSLWFSHEMSNRELWDSFEKMGAKREMIAFVPETLEEDTDWLFKHIDKAIEEQRIRVVFIDTLGDLVRSEKNQKDLGNYATYLGQLCKDLRNYAVRKQIMIVAVAHATKQTRSNSNETNNSDIANSNGIPAAATNIFHVWRDNETDNRSFVKIGKSRRNGASKNHKFSYLFENHRLISEGRHEDIKGEQVWRTKS